MLKAMPMGQGRQRPFAEGVRRCSGLGGKTGNSGVLLFRWRRVCVYMHVHPLINHKARALQRQLLSTSTLVCYLFTHTPSTWTKISSQKYARVCAYTHTRIFFFLIKGRSRGFQSQLQSPQTPGCCLSTHTHSLCNKPFQYGGREQVAPLSPKGPSVCSLRSQLMTCQCNMLALAPEIKMRA